ncbi:MAG: hypothetical protein FGM15_06605 [Chthoniobacterales bacterium]|nr:hypothetical protein [Chthoniobacterales bacterium]
MLIDAQKIDDFKTPRKDLLPPLPLVFRLIPIVFYLSLVFLAVVGSLAMWHARVATMRYQDTMKQRSALEAEIASTKAARSELERNYREATQLYSWVESSVPLQPLLLKIIKSMDPGSVIVDLTLERDAANPAQIKLALTFNSKTDDQIVKTVAAIRDMGYLEFSPTQTKIKGNLEYRAVLLRNRTAADLLEQTPSDRSRGIVPL